MDYQQIEVIIVKSGSGQSAAEAHGMATGMLCCNRNTAVDFWLNEVLDEGTFADENQKSILVKLFEESRSWMSEEEFGFELLLPDDESPLEEQIGGMRDWCQGFVYGIGAVGQKEALSEDVRDTIKDIVEFTKLDTDAEGEEAENDFMELTEFLRAAVMFLRTELNSADTGRFH